MAEDRVEIALKIDISEKKAPKPPKGQKPLAAGRAPTQTLADQVQRGGIYGFEVEPKKPVDFQKRAKQIRGGVERTRDDRSKTGHSAERYIFEQKRLHDHVDEALKTSRALRNIINVSIDKFAKANQILANPAGAVGSEVIKMVGGTGPYGVAFVAGITALIAAPEVANAIIKSLAQKGLLLNRDYVRDLENDVNILLDVEDKKKRLVGLDSFIITQQDRFDPGQGAYSTNSLENRDEIIIAKSIGLAERAAGVIYN